MTSEQIDKRLDELGSNSLREWTPADYEAVLLAYQRADRATKDQVWAILGRSKAPRSPVD